MPITMANNLISYQDYNDNDEIPKLKTTIMVTILRHNLKTGQWQVDDNDEYHKNHRVSSGVEYHGWSRTHLWHVSMQECKYASVVCMQVCNYASRQVCKYASMQVCKFASMMCMQVLYVCRYASIQVQYVCNYVKHGGNSLMTGGQIWK